MRPKEQESPEEEQIESFAFSKAIRRAVPMLLSVSGTSGSGKTYSSLLVAAGLAGEKGRVGLIDTENGRGALYADSPGIRAALPNGFDIARLDAPFSPKRYTAAIKSAEAAGITVCVLDSTSHEWEGIGGACEIAEKKKLRGMPNWALAKMEHKRFMNQLLSTNMHVIFCLRAREKIKIIKVNGKDEIIPVGIQPIAEKNFVFEMLVSLQLDEQTHFATPIKVPEPLVPLFPGGKLLTGEDGERIRIWNETGDAPDQFEQIRKRARSAAEDGMESYKAFFGALTPAQRKGLGDKIHAENKAIAEKVDKERAEAPPEDYEQLPDPYEFEPGHRLSVNGKIYACNADRTAWEPAA